MQRTRESLFQRRARHPGVEHHLHKRTAFPASQIGKHAAILVTVCIDGWEEFARDNPRASKFTSHEQEPFLVRQRERGEQGSDKQSAAIQPYC